MNRKGVQMRRSCVHTAGTIAVLSILTTNTVPAQLMSTCVPELPERRGEIGCSVIQSKARPEGLSEPVFWRIDRFGSRERARAAAGPASIAFDAAGVWWLMTIERETTDHHVQISCDHGSVRVPDDDIRRFAMRPGRIALSG